MMKNNNGETEPESLVEEFKNLQKKNSELRKQYNNILTSAQQENETVDHRRLRALTSQNQQLRTQIRYLTSAQTTRSEMVSSLEQIIGDLGSSLKSSKTKNYDSINRWKQTAVQCLRKYRQQIQKTEAQAYLGLESNKYYFDFSPFLDGRTTLDPNAFRDFESFSSSSKKKKSLKNIKVKKSVSQLFTLHNIFLNQLKRYAGYNKTLDDMLDGCEVPPFINLVNVGFLEEKIGKVYQNIVRFLTLSENMDREKERKIKNNEDEDEGESDVEFQEEEEEDIYGREKKRILARLGRDLTVLRDELVEFSLIVPPKYSKSRKRKSLEEEKDFHDIRDDFELKFVQKKVWNRFFKGGRPEYKSTLKSMVDCYRKQRRIWKIEKQILLEKIKFVEHLTLVYKNRKIPQIPKQLKKPKKSRKPRKSKNSKESENVFNENEILLSFIHSLESLSSSNTGNLEKMEKIKNLESTGVESFEVVLNNFENFEKLTDGNSLKVFLNSMRKHYSTLRNLLSFQVKKKEFLESCKFGIQNSLLESINKRKKEFEKSKKVDFDENIGKIDEERILGDEEIEKYVEEKKLQYDQKEEKEISRIYKIEESLMKEKMYMKEEPKFVDYQPNPMIQKSKIFSVYSGNARRGQNKGGQGTGHIRDGHQPMKVKLSKVNSNLLEMKKKRKKLKERILKLDANLSDKKKTQFQKYAIKKKRALEVASLKKIERTIKELTD